ncbi:MAG TPA: hypothetical protein VFT56_06270 [Sphingomonas sp.]|nr:hypothetical protein [Sphingomonas sp.]
MRRCRRNRPAFDAAGSLSMATRKSRAKALAKKPIVAKDSDPQSWLFLNPNGPSEAGLVFGVLRKQFGGRTNSAAEFARRKLQPVAPPGDAEASPWPVTAVRAEVILPQRADDILADPQTLMQAMDQAAIEREKALLIYLTLPLADVDRLHDGWERVWAFVREQFARDRQLAVLMALHSPGQVNSANPLHCHCLIVPRRLGGLGLAHGAYDEELIRDAGQTIMEAAWAEHVATFR